MLFFDDLINFYMNYFLSIPHLLTTQQISYPHPAPLENIFDKVRGCAKKIQPRASARAAARFPHSLFSFLHPRRALRRRRNGLTLTHSCLPKPVAVGHHSPNRQSLIHPDSLIPNHTRASCKKVDWLCNDHTATHDRNRFPGLHQIKSHGFRENDDHLPLTKRNLFNGDVIVSNTPPQDVIPCMPCATGNDPRLFVFAPHFPQTDFVIFCKRPIGIHDPHWTPRKATLRRMAQIHQLNAGISAIPHCLPEFADCPGHN